MLEDITQETQQTQEPQPDNPLANGAADELAMVASQLDEEKKAKSALEQAVTERDTKVTELGKALSESQQQSEVYAAELVSIKESRDQTVSKYLAMAKTLNPTIPEDIIDGETIEEIDQSIEKSKAIVEAVKKAMKSEAAAASVPAGAPPRGGISTEGMSPKEKIAYAIQHQGGTS